MTGFSPPDHESPRTKCLVHGCLNHTDEGGFYAGPLCALCHHMLTTGEVAHGQTFIHELKRQLAATTKENQP